LQAYDYLPRDGGVLATASEHPQPVKSADAQLLTADEESIDGLHGPGSRQRHPNDSMRTAAHPDEPDGTKTCEQIAVVKSGQCGDAV